MVVEKLIASDYPDGAPKVRPPPIPAPPLPALDAIPEELRPLKRWVCWCYRIKEGKPRKVPLQVDGRNANVSDPATWSTLEDVHAVASRHG